MNVYLKKKTLQRTVIAVEGRIDANNADAFFEDMIKFRRLNPEGTFVIDADALTYISSAGLRSVLMLVKNEKETPLRIINASSEIMEVFEDTGFSSVIRITRKPHTISVDGCKVIGRGANGVVYRLDDDKIVKVYAETASLEEISKEQDLAQKAFFKGIPTAIAYSIVRVGKAYGVVFELIDAVSLSEMLVAEASQYEIYLRKYVRIYKEIHSACAEKGEFPHVKDIYYGYIDGCADWYTKEELDQLRKLVASIPDADTLIHGDYHPRNIMVQKGELIMIDMGDMSIGHPVFDFLATAATQANLPDLDPEYAQYHTGMPVALIRRLWNDLLEQYFPDKSPEEIRKIDQQIRILSKLKVAVVPVVAKNAAKEIIEASVADARNNLLPIVDDLIGTINW